MDSYGVGGVMQKRPPLRSKALRDSARGQPCTVRIPGVCDGGGETTVMAHLREAGRCGIGQKPSDLEAVYACGPCHDVLDSRMGYADPSGVTREELALSALKETHARMHEAGLISVKGAKWSR